jgi:hypothetical protein
MRTAHLILALCLAALSLLGPRTAHAAPALDNCTGFVDALPATISAPGTWCLRANLVSGTWVGAPYAAITIASDDVVLDCNGFGIRGPGINSDYSGIQGYQRNRVTVRRCSVSRYRIGIVVEDYDDVASDVRYEDNVVTDIGYGGLWSSERNTVMAGNHVARIGGYAYSTDYYGIVVKDGSVVDNTIEDMVWPRTWDGQTFRVTGINAGGPGHVTIRGNRIRKLRADYGWGAIGIWLNGVGDATVLENDIAGDMVNAQGDFKSIGIFCFADSPIHVPTVDNVITGFPVAVQGCQGKRANDESP